MNIQQLTWPTSTVIDLQKAKDHLRVTTTDEDALILDCIKAATDLVETYTNQLFQSRTYVAYMDAVEFSAYNHVKIWLWPITSIDSVKYLDTDGVEQTFSSANYSTDLSDSPARILPTTIATVKQNVVNAYRIYFTAGYTNTDQINPELLNWIKIFIGFFYQTRQPEYSGFTVAEIAYKYQTALDKYRKDPIV